MPTILDIAKAAGVSAATVSRVLNNRHGVSESVAQKVRETAELLRRDERPALPTIRDVAALAGVSTATVSNVINGRAVGGKTRQLVLDAIEKLDYKPNKIGRMLRRERRNTIIIASDALVTSCLQGAFAAARALGFDIMFIHASISDYDDFENSFKYGDACGVIFINSYNASIVQALSQEYPVVQCGAYVDALHSSIVSLDYEKAAFSLTNQLLRQGRKKICFLTSFGNSVSSYLYHQYYNDGIIKAIDSSGKDISFMRLDLGNHLYSMALEDHMRHISGLLEMSPSCRPDAIISTSSGCAMIYENVLIQSGVKVPDDIAIASLDDGASTRSCCPCITSVEQPLYKMGYESVRLLGDILSGKVSEHKHILFDHRIYLRGSTNAELYPFGQSLLCEKKN